MLKKSLLNKIRYYLSEEQRLGESSVNLCLDAIKLATTWKIKPSALNELKEGEAILAYSFGMGKRKDGKEEIANPENILYHPEIYFPGKSNEDLAIVISSLYDFGIKKPIYAQWEIATALLNIGISMPETNIARPNKGYLSTSGVIQQFLETGLKNYKKIILVAFPTHIPRARATTISEIKKQTGKGIDSILIANTFESRYDSDSIQPWTRSEEANVNYELGGRAQHVFYKKTLPIDLF